MSLDNIVSTWFDIGIFRVWNAWTQMGAIERILYNCWWRRENWILLNAIAFHFISPHPPTLCDERILFATHLLVVKFNHLEFPILWSVLTMSVLFGGWANNIVLNNAKKGPSKNHLWERPSESGHSVIRLNFLSPIFYWGTADGKTKDETANLIAVLRIDAFNIG